MAEALQPSRSVSYFSRIAWGIGCVFVLVHALVALYHAHESLVSQATGLVVSTAERARVIGDLTAGRTDRRLALRKISVESFSIALAPQPFEPPPDHRRWHREALVRSRAVQGLTDAGLTAADVRFHFAFRRGDARLQLSLPDAASGAWLVVSAAARPARWQRHAAGLVWTACLALLIFGLVFWVTRRYTRSLPAFVAAAERIGNQGTTELLPENSGPREIRRLGVAFNRMQQRIKSHERERSTMLGAVSHDLRTLITRLSLRLQNDAGLQSPQKLQRDLEAMTRIVDEALAYSADEASDETPMALELCSLLQTLIDDRNELRGDDEPEVTGVFGEAGAVRLRAQPHALRRAVQNVIDNALLYGGSAQVSVRRESGWAIIEIKDRGAGIPAADHGRVLAPYVRLESSRNRATGGTGLGLAICNNVLRRQGGRVSFENGSDGFSVLLYLPA